MLLYLKTNLKKSLRLVDNLSEWRWTISAIVLQKVFWLAVWVKQDEIFPQNTLDYQTAHLSGNKHLLPANWCAICPDNELCDPTSYFKKKKSPCICTAGLAAEFKYTAAGELGVRKMILVYQLQQDNWTVIGW